MMANAFPRRFPVWLLAKMHLFWMLAGHDWLRQKGCYAGLGHHLLVRCHMRRLSSCQWTGIWSLALTINLSRMRRRFIGQFTSTKLIRMRCPPETYGARPML